MLSVILPSASEAQISDFVKEVEEKLPVTEIITINDRYREGKGKAIRYALSYATGDEICFLDGDGDIPPRMLLRMLPFLEDFDVVVGSKRITHSPLRRKIMTHLTRWWFKLLYGVKVDTQTGIKLFRREALDMLGRYWESNGFIFDVEILANLQRQGARMIEVPIECEIKRQLPFKQIFRILGESLWLRWRLWFPS